jgi:hypothetical protein
MDFGTPSSTMASEGDIYTTSGYCGLCLERFPSDDEGVLNPWDLNFRAGIYFCKAIYIT